ncbi:MAG: NAD(P)H-dependent oxidoreductase subunit E [Desulfovibrio sp.]|jgi:NADH:ubiquinone oxidoreductase subunit E|nr:NAD(P)H-dependent oxidoreductase subunit E [Desulfovibrio sp.]
MAECALSNADADADAVHAISLVICMGTCCYIKGASAYLDDLVHVVQQKYGDAVHISAGNCLGQCLLENSEPPYVKVDDEIITHATIKKILEYIDERFTRAV